MAPVSDHNNVSTKRQQAMKRTLSLISLKHFAPLSETWSCGETEWRLLSSPSEPLDRPACRAAILWLGPTLLNAPGAPAGKLPRSGGVRFQLVHTLPHGVLWPQPPGVQLRSSADSSNTYGLTSERPQTACTVTLGGFLLFYSLILRNMKLCSCFLALCQTLFLCSDLWFRFCRDNKSLLIRAKPGSCKTWIRCEAWTESNLKPEWKSWH